MRNFITQKYLSNTCCSKVFFLVSLVAYVAPKLLKTTPCHYVF